MIIDIFEIASAIFVAFWMVMIAKCAARNGFVETFKTLNK